MRQPALGFVIDANVLIDYASADLSVLGEFSRVAGPVHVPDEVLDKVRSVDRCDCDQLGIFTVQPTLDQLLEAGEGPGRIAFDDRLCLIPARDNAWVCVTNDKALRSECEMASVRVLWGLEPMLELVARGAMGLQEAESVARRIHESNPTFVTQSIVDRFVVKLHGLER